MPDRREEAERFLSETEGEETALRRVLEVDGRVDDWRFDDVDVDSGTFGEVVSRGLVERTGEGYRVPDRAALADALADAGVEPPGPERASAKAGTRSFLPGVVGGRARSVGFGRVGAPLTVLRERGWSGVDWTAAGALGGALVLLVAVRMLALPSVFRGGDVVLPGNDPYAYRYWTEHLLAEHGLFDPAALTSLPEFVRTGDALLFATLWAGVSMVPGSAGTVLAAYPVVAAGLTGLAVYATVRRLTPDRRVALAAVVMLAVTPIHAYRTSFGFADHHAFDYLWLAVTLLALVALRSGAADRPLPDRLLSPRRLAAGVLLGVSLTAQLYAWRGSPILIAPIVAYAVVIAVADARDGRSPTGENPQFLLGVGLAACLAALVRVSLGWASDYRAFVLAAALAVVLAVFATCEVAVRTRVTTRTAGVASVVVAGVTVAGIWVGTSLFTRLYTRAVSWVGGALRRDTAGTVSLLDPGQGALFAPVLQFGFVLFVALPVVLAVTRRAVRGEETLWLAPAVYVWYLLGWTTLFVRFGGSLAVAAAPFAGYGFLALVDRVGAARAPVLEASPLDRPPRAERSGVDRSDVPNGERASERIEELVPDLDVPSQGTVRALVVLFLLVGSFSFVQIPVSQVQIAVEGETYETATGIASDADARGLSYPENRVLSRWPKYRVFNYFANGQSASYVYAEDTYEPFVLSTDPDGWYERLRDDVGYVVVSRAEDDPPATSIYNRLFRHYGSATARLDGVAHFRALYVSERERHKVFDVVPGAVLTGSGPANATVTVETTVDVGGEAVPYRRHAETTANGHFAVRVPNPGTYHVERGAFEAGDRSTTVTGSDVESGGFIAEEGDSAHWTFDEGQGTVVFDETGGNHGFANGTRWTDGRRGGALGFDGDAFVRVPSPPPVTPASGVTVAASFRTDPDADFRGDGKYRPVVAHSPASGVNIRREGYLLAVRDGRLVGTVGDGDRFRHIVGPPVDDGEWHRAVLRWNGTHVSLALDGDRVAVKPFTTVVPLPDHDTYVGGPPGYQKFEGVVGGVTVGNGSIDPRTRLSAPDGSGAVDEE